LPDADVIVNPNIPGSTFGSRALAGVGVAFYVMAAVRREIDARGFVVMPPVADFLDLVALGTVADLVPLDANNRVLVAQGIRRIRAGRSVPGIRALLEIGKRSVETLTAADLGFTIGPRLNAAGRLDDMSIGIRCLLANNEAEAQALAARLDELNVERREIEARMQGVALAAVKSLRHPEANAPTRHGVCLFDADWHQGVVGLVASRIKDRVRRPVIAFARNADGTLRGSARSVPGIHIRDVLDGIATRHPELINRFGGHAMAAGLTIEERHLDAFARAFDEEVTRWRDPSIPSNRVETDGELSSDEIALETAQALRDGGPWGQAFPEPCFDGRFEIRNARVVGEKHLKMWVTTGDQSRNFDAIAFNFRVSDEETALPEGDVRLVYRLDINEYKGERRLQLLVDHVLP
jgi:single-stranded-DNA-specific exonuclease